MSSIKTVTDNNGVRYELSELLGRGGQGAVYAVQGGRLAVKLISAKSNTQRDCMRNQLMHVRRLPLRELCLAKPLEMLRPPHIGYVMELLTGMIPIKSLLAPKKGEDPSIEWYMSGGGLRRRLLLLGRAASVLAQLHGKGLAYSDPSPANIFVSQSADAHEVWFIDTDNLQYESSPHSARNSVFTPGMGAPELIHGRSGVTTLTDAYSMAVLAFHTLTLAHPFIGDLVNKGGPELEEAAFEGKLPWIDDPADDRNRATFGVPRAWVLSKRLHEAFGKAFGPGRMDPTARPGASEWAEILFAAADATIECSECKGTYYFTQENCPWCAQARPAFAMGIFSLWDPAFGPHGGILVKPVGDNKRAVLVGHGAVSEGQTFIITRRLAYGQYKGPINEPVVAVTLAGDRLKLKSLDGNNYPFSSPTGSQKTEVGDRVKVIKLEERQASWNLHFGSSDTLHRVVSFQLHRGAIA
jgi:DNA-binding helix-hairpin-helix protein with protein kinase domain